MTALARHAGRSGAPPRLRLHADGLRPSPRWTPPGDGTLDRAVADAAVARAGRRSAHGHHQPGAEERLPGHARDVQRRVPQRGQGEVDREHRLLPGHDGRSDRGASRSAARRCCPRSSWRWICCTTVGQCDNGYACVYQNNLSWSSPTTPLPAEAHPRDRLRAPVRRRRQRRRTAARRCSKSASLLDWVQRRHRPPAEEARPRRPRQGRASISTPCARWSAASRRPRPQTADIRLPDLDRPVGVPAAYADHARLMFDLQVLALQGDVTRVITFQLARETSNRTYPEIGVPDPHHPLTHHGERSGEDRAGWRRSTRSTSRCSPISSRS